MAGIKREHGPEAVVFLNGLIHYINQCSPGSHITLDALTAIVAQILVETKVEGATDADVLDDFRDNLRLAVEEERTRRGER